MINVRPLPPWFNICACVRRIAKLKSKSGLEGFWGAGVWIKQADGRGVNGSPCLMCKIKGIWFIWNLDSTFFHWNLDKSKTGDEQNENPWKTTRSFNPRDIVVSRKWTWIRKARHCYLLEKKIILNTLQLLELQQLPYQEACPKFDTNSKWLKASIWSFLFLFKPCNLLNAIQ